MENIKFEVAKSEAHSHAVDDAQLWELSDLQLALVGGGAGDVTLS